MFLRELEHKEKTTNTNNRDEISIGLDSREQ